MVYEQLSALLLDKQTFARAFFLYTMEVMQELWPDDCKDTEPAIELKQAVARFEEVLKTIRREMMLGLPLKRLENANAVKQLSFSDDDRKSTLLLVFSGKSGETTMLCDRNRAKVLRSAFHVIHAKALMKEAFLQQSQLIGGGNENERSRNGAIWAFMAQRYWKRLAKDIAVVVDHSNVLQDLNAAHV
jgi:hypothetical protein